MIFGADEAPVVEAGGAEIDQKCPLKTRCFQVVENLSGFNVRQCLDRLQLNDDGVEAEEIGAIGCTERFPFVADRDSMLPNVGNVPLDEFHLKCILIYAFEKAISQHPMHLHRRSDDRKGLRIFLRICVHLRNLRITLRVAGIRTCTPPGLCDRPGGHCR